MATRTVTGSPTQSIATDALARSVPAKVRARLIPFMFLLYVVSYLDRINVGFAALQMNAELHLTPAVYGFGAGIFFLGYCLLEVPSNLVLERVGARVWIARIMIMWGIISTCMMFVRTPTSFYVLRFMLGVAEAGFFPGMILYLTYWFPAAERCTCVGAVHYVNGHVGHHWWTAIWLVVVFKWNGGVVRMAVAVSRRRDSGGVAGRVGAVHPPQRSNRREMVNRY